MNLVMLAAVVIAALIFIVLSRSSNDDDQACANEIVDLFKHDRATQAKQVAEVMRKHGRSIEDIEAVTKLLKPKLTRTALSKDEVSDALVEVRSAKKLL